MGIGRVFVPSTNGISVAALFLSIRAGNSLTGIAFTKIRIKDKLIKDQQMLIWDPKKHFFLTSGLHWSTGLHGFRRLFLHPLGPDPLSWVFLFGVDFPEQWLDWWHETTSYESSWNGLGMCNNTWSKQFAKLSFPTLFIVIHLDFLELYF